MGRARHGGENGIGLLEKQENEVLGTVSVCNSVTSRSSGSFQMPFEKWGHYVLGGEESQVLSCCIRGSGGTRAQGVAGKVLAETISEVLG